MIRRSSISSAVAIIVAAVVLLGGCGISADGEPQAIAPEDLPPDLVDPNPVSSTTLPPSPGTTSIAVYFLTTEGDRERLIEVQREVTDLDPRKRIDTLLSGPAEDEREEEGITTVIPGDTALIDIQLDPSGVEAVIELSEDLYDIEGEELAKAFAQIVWTVTEVDSGVRRVRFIIDGVEIRIPDDESVERDGAVSRVDYANLAPARD